LVTADDEGLVAVVVWETGAVIGRRIEILIFIYSKRKAYRLVLGHVLYEDQRRYSTQFF